LSALARANRFSTLNDAMRIAASPPSHHSGSIAPQPRGALAPHKAREAEIMLPCFSSGFNGPVARHLRPGSPGRTRTPDPGIMRATTTFDMGKPEHLQPSGVRATIDSATSDRPQPTRFHATAHAMPTSPGRGLTGLSPSRYAVRGRGSDVPQSEECQAAPSIGNQLRGGPICRGRPRVPVRSFAAAPPRARIAIGGPAGCSSRRCIRGTRRRRAGGRAGCGSHIAVPIPAPARTGRTSPGTG
jgi:hypothetical protein